MRKIIVGLTLCSLSWSCEAVLGPSEHVILSTDLTAYAHGESVLLRLQNETSGDIYYNLCVSPLERKDLNGNWVPAPSERYCILPLWGLPPGGEASDTHVLPADLLAGRYRFRTTVHGSSGEDWTIYSNEFYIAS